MSLHLHRWVRDGALLRRRAAQFGCGYSSDGAVPRISGWTGSSLLLRYGADVVDDLVSIRREDRDGDAYRGRVRRERCAVNLDDRMVVRQVEESLLLVIWQPRRYQVPVAVLFEIEA